MAKPTPTTITPRRVVQIAAAGGDETEALFALTDDGTIWRRTYDAAGSPSAWKQVAPLPAREE